MIKTKIITSSEVQLAIYYEHMLSYSQINNRATASKTELHFLRSREKVLSVAELQYLRITSSPPIRRSNLRLTEKKS